MGANRLQQWLLRAGLLVSTVLLVRFAVDFSAGMQWWLAVPFCALVLVTLAVAATNVFRFGAKTNSVGIPGGRLRLGELLLLLAIPLGFLASSLDCMGLTLWGCSSFCSFVKLGWIPVMTAICGVYAVTGNRTWLTALAGVSFVPLVPHCVCYNIGNSWWIDRIGASPLCYGWGFVVSVIAIGVLNRSLNLWLAVVLCFAIIGGALAFFISHHYFQFPW